MGITSNTHRSSFFGQLPCCLESSGVVTWEGRGCCALGDRCSLCLLPWMAAIFALSHVADVVVVVVVFP